VQLSVEDHTQLHTYQINRSETPPSAAPGTIWGDLAAPSFSTPQTQTAKQTYHVILLKPWSQTY
jgi:hypothetical protein